MLSAEKTSRTRVGGEARGDDVMRNSWKRKVNKRYSNSSARWPAMPDASATDWITRIWASPAPPSATNSENVSVEPPTLWIASLSFDLNKNCFTTTLRKHARQVFLEITFCKLHKFKFEHLRRSLLVFHIKSPEAVDPSRWIAVTVKSIWTNAEHIKF